MIEVYRGDDDHSKTTPWLTTLAMEWGRRDIDEFLAASNRAIDHDNLPDWKIQVLVESLKSAALVGLSEDDPSAAWSRFNDDDSTAVTRTSSDFILPVIAAAKTRPLTAEAIFRSWAKIDAASAWNELSSSDDRDTTKLAPAIRGLLAESKSAELRKDIEDWVNQTFLENIFQGIPPTAGFEVTNIIGSSRQGDSVITRNSIDSILNNPNRTALNPHAMQGALALGLAEQNSSLVGKLTAPAAVDSQRFIPMHSFPSAKHCNRSNKTSHVLACPHRPSRRQSKR